MPAKYRSMCDFHEYYSGQREAPYLTVFVGGNHEASNHLFELYYGGWVAPNIYFMGAANVLRLGPLRIAGMSGIWKGHDYRKPHFERLPYNESDTKSIYHVRELDIRKLLQISTQVDVGVSHDWPQGVEWKGDTHKLFRKKRFFEDDARSGRLGSVAARHVMERLRPKYWFSAHLHCKFTAVVSHETQVPLGSSADPNNAASRLNDANAGHVPSDTEQLPDAVVNVDKIDLDLDLDEAPAAPALPPPETNADEIDLDMDEGLDIDMEDQMDGNVDSAPGPTASTLEAARAALPASFRAPPPREDMEHPPEISNLATKFLALDKCLPGRQFLQLTLIPSSEPIVRPLNLAYDPEWLAITRAFALAEPPIFGDPDARVPPAKTQAQYRELISAQREWIDAHLYNSSDSQGASSPSSLAVPDNFELTAPVFDGGNWQLPQYEPANGGLREYTNPQTARFCAMLALPNPLHLSEEERDSRMAAGPGPDPFNDANRFRHGQRGRGRSGRGGRGRGARGGMRGGTRGGARGG